MKNITVDFQKTCGPVKPMHAVNNGPIYKFNPDQRVTNMDSWKEAGIPYSRLHDSPRCSTYGGPHIVDVNLIFTNFDADPTLPESYDFDNTDEYLRVIDFAGTKVFYRLGASIEHWIKKYNTRPPKDFKKWAVICEHIIRHYTEGWANGFHYDIQYWEIWNEPDWGKRGGPNSATWGGTMEEFYDFFEIAAKYLKTTFPHLKIGGPASVGKADWCEIFLDEMRQRNVPLDFFSWHKYGSTVEKVTDFTKWIRETLDKAGYTETESICNEWNYMKGWTNEDYVYSRKSIKGIKGASYTAAVMCACQYEAMDLLMYYDAKPCGFNGLFDSDVFSLVLKGYYPFKMFNELYKLGHCCQVETDEHLYACAAVNGGKAALMLTHFYDDDDQLPAEEIKLNFSGFAGENGVKVFYYLLNKDRDMELIKEETITSDSFAPVIKADLFASYLVTFEKL